MSKQAKRDIFRKLKILNYARKTGNISKTCRYFGISREIFYQWKRSYESFGETALINSKPCPENRSIRVPQAIEEKILHLRKTYHFGAQRIAWYLDRYHSVKVSSGGVQGVLRRHGINRLPQNMKSLAKRNSYQLYEKQVPGHHVQIDVKFLKFIDKSRKTIRRFQYTEYKGDVDLEKKMTIWENFYNFQRPHGAHVGKTPYEVLREKLSA